VVAGVVAEVKIMLKMVLVEAAEALVVCARVLR
jgi:hypothetical protein